MRKTWTKRLLSSFVAVMMGLSLLPASALAAEPSVAQIGDTTYGTLDAAIAAASDGDTITLLADATVSTTLDKSITIDGQNRYTLTSTDKRYGFSTGRSLTFRNLTANFNYTIEIENPTYTSDLSLFYVNGDTDFTFENATINMDGSGATNRLHAFYYDGGSVGTITISNSNFNVKNFPEDVFEWSGNTSNLIINNSTVILDNNRSGITGTWDVQITDSTLQVLNSTGNGSNGSNYYIDHSTVVYNNNGSHGLSATDLNIVHGSKVTADNNGYYGVYANGDFLVDSTSTLTVTRNSSKDDFAGLKLYTGVTDGKVEDGATVIITDNYCSGLSNNGKVVFEEDVDLTIMNNNNDKGTTSNGGGVYNSGDSANLTLPSDAVIYNNHTDTAGDDIFNNSTSTITFGQVGSGWVLDDCDHIIDGWYDDSANARWEAHAETEEGNHIQEVAAGTLNGVYALKAAHGENAQDKTSYPGLEKKVWDDGQEAWVDGITSADAMDVNFKLTSNVPDDLLNYIEADPAEPPEVETPPAANLLAEERGAYKLVIHDKMDKAFVDPDSFVVTLDREGTENDVELNDTQYTLTNPGADGCTFDITIDLAALYEAGMITEADITNATPIVVTYTATLAEGTTAGTYKNTSWVTAPGDWETEVDEVTVDTYAISIFKYDQTDGTTGLSGATFELYQKNGEGSVIESSKVILTSGPDGIAKADGLDAGTYYLKETKAPEGYVGSDQEVEVVIPEKAGTDNVATVNFANSPIPHTGGMGTAMFTVGGAAILAAAGVLFVVSRRKDET